MFHTLFQIYLFHIYHAVNENSVFGRYKLLCLPFPPRDTNVWLRDSQAQARAVSRIVTPSRGRSGDDAERDIDSELEPQFVSHGSPDARIHRDPSARRPVVPRILSRVRSATQTAHPPLLAQRLDGKCSSRATPKVLVPASPVIHFDFIMDDTRPVDYM